MSESAGLEAGYRRLLAWYGRSGISGVLDPLQLLTASGYLVGGAALLVSPDAERGWRLLSWRHVGTDLLRLVTPGHEAVLFTPPVVFACGVLLNAVWPRMSSVSTSSGREA